MQKAALLFGLRLAFRLGNKRFHQILPVRKLRELLIQRDELRPNLVFPEYFSQLLKSFPIPWIMFQRFLACFGSVLIFHGFP